MREILPFVEIWDVEYFGNTLEAYLFFVLAFFVLSLTFYLLKHYFLKKISQKLKGKEIIDLMLDVVNQIRSPFYIFLSFYIALFLIEVPEILSSIFWFILVLWIAYRAVIAGQQFVDFGLSFYIKKRTGEDDKAMIRNLGNIAKVILWIFALLTILSIMGVNITALVAGMGIGGVAIAFALQNILSDLFSSFSIFFDKPFKEGDLIVVGGKWGTVEKIGIKSTRVRALYGEEIVFSNKELTTVQVHNMKKMEQRRTDFDIGVTYETPTEKLEKIPEIIKNIVEKEELAEFSRTHFSSFGDFSLNFTVVYFIKTPDYTDFMDTNERVFLAIKREFEKEGIEFAYPTKTIYLAKNTDN